MRRPPCPSGTLALPRTKLLHQKTIKRNPRRVRLDKRWCNYCPTRIECDGRVRECNAANPPAQARKTIWGQRRVLKESRCQFFVVVFFYFPRPGKDRSNESNSHTRDAIMISEMWTFALQELAGCRLHAHFSRIQHIPDSCILFLQ